MLKKLIILPFDHLSSFSRELLKQKGKPSQKAVKQIKYFKNIIFQAFLKVYNKSENKKDLAILVDEQYGREVIKKAQKLGIKLCLPVEKSGQKEFRFEHGNSFARKILEIDPDFVKVLIRYNSQNKLVNKKQLERLKRLNKFCVRKNYPLILELLVPATMQDLKTAGSKIAYDKRIRPGKTALAIKEIRKVIKDDVWKLEGTTQKNWSKIIKKIDEKSGIIVLGRGEDKEQVIKWLGAAKRFKKIIGFAIGRTIFLRPLKKMLSKEYNKTQTIEKIAKNFEFFIKFW